MGEAPGLSLDDYMSSLSPMEQLQEAYDLERRVSVFSDIVKTLGDEILRNGLDWKPAFAKRCGRCGHKMKEAVDVCDLCGSENLVDTDPRQLLFFQHSDGSTFLERANDHDSMIRTLKICEFHIEVSNRGVIHVQKMYISADGKEVHSYPISISALDPRFVIPVFDEVTGKMGGHGRVCLFHSPRQLLSKDDTKCPRCGCETHEVHYRTIMPNSPERYYIADEILMVSKYGPEKFGLPPIFKLIDDAVAYEFAEKRIRVAFEKARPPGLLAIPTTTLDKIKALFKQTSELAKNDANYIPWISVPPDGRQKIEFIKLLDNLGPEMIPIKDDIRKRMGSWYGLMPLWQGDVATSGGLNNEKQQLTISNRSFLEGQRIFNEDILPWICRQFHITDYVLQLVPAEDADELRDEQLMSARLDNVNKALQVGLDVEWKDKAYSISGTPKLQEQTYSPVSLPDVPANSGEVSKALQKKCPSGEHEHPDFPYCHPEDRQHRTEGGRNDDAENPSDPRENRNDDSKNSIDAAENLEQLEKSVKEELKSYIPDLQIDISFGDMETCKTSMKQFVNLAKQYKTNCKRIDVGLLQKASAYAATSRSGDAIRLNTPYFSENKGSLTPGAQRTISLMRTNIKLKQHPPVREGEEIESIMTHEFAHTLVNSQFYEEIKELWGDYEIKDEPIVSYNSLFNIDEFVADCFMSVYHTDNPPEIARAVVDRLNRYFRRDEE